MTFYKYVIALHDVTIVYFGLIMSRYLCWNNIGAITILHGDGDLDYRNKVDIHFTDSAYKRPISFTDNMNFILGSLGDDGAIFASLDLAYMHTYCRDGTSLRPNLTVTVA